MAWSPQISLDRLASLLQGSPWLFIPGAEFAGVCGHAGPLYVGLGVGTQVLMLSKEALYSLSILPDPINTGFELEILTMVERT